MSSARITALIAIAILTGLGIIILINHTKNGSPTSGATIATCFIAFSLAPWWVFLKYDDEIHRKRIRFSIKLSAILGGASFLAGFVGPIIFSPESNQGPLLGIFITGPAGLAIGFIVGVLISFFKYPNK